MFTPTRDKIAIPFLVFLILAVVSTGSAFAQEMPSLNAGDTSRVLTSSVLVLAMIVPGLSLFYGGMVR